MAKTEDRTARTTKKEASRNDEGVQAFADADLIGALMEHLDEVEEAFLEGQKLINSINPTLGGYLVGLRHGFEFVNRVIEDVANKVVIGQAFRDSWPKDVFPQLLKR